MNIKPSIPTKPDPTLSTKFWQWLVNRVSDEVPSDVGLCEFDCRNLDCTVQRWEHCERRLRQASGELWPAPAGEPCKSAKPAPDAPQSKGRSAIQE